MTLPRLVCLYSDGDGDDDDDDDDDDGDDDEPADEVVLL